MGNSETKYRFRLTTATGMNPVKLVVKLVEGESQIARVEHDLNVRFKTSRTHITVTELETVKEIAVDIDITHTNIGDLRVAVGNPQNREVVRQAQEGRSADDIQRPYTVDEKPALRDFIGQPAQGDWVLTVGDNAWRDVGKLNRWSLTLR